MRLAHLTDPHLDGSQRRQWRLLAALERARAFGAGHLVLTGDLTAHGEGHEYGALAVALAPWPTHMVTLVPGNHDGAGTWQEVLRSTPLARFAPHCRAGAYIDRGAMLVVAVDSTVEVRTPIFRALGRVGARQLCLLETLARSTDKCIVVAMHHGPWRGPLCFFDKLLDRSGMYALLERHAHVYVCCGHHHRIVDRERVFAAGSVVNHPDPLRLYDVLDGRLVPIYQSPRAVGEVIWE